jgi:hypothetical protein
MPICFQLTKIGGTEPTTLSDIDNEICAMLGATPDPIFYHMDWVDIIGMKFASGKTLTEIADDYALRVETWKGEDGKTWVTEMLALVTYLANNYTADSWYERRNASK